MGKWVLPEMEFTGDEMFALLQALENAPGANAARLYERIKGRRVWFDERIKARPARALRDRLKGETT